MRSLQETRLLWHHFESHASIDELREAIRIVDHEKEANIKLRSAYWKAFLLLDALTTTSWLSTLSSSRSAYDSLRSRFTTGNDELYHEIRQDVERCMPGIPFFQESKIQSILTNILLVFCRLNPDLSYRQGMHELLAPILWVIDQDAIEGQHTTGENALIATIFNADYVEHDAFTLFSQVMQNAKKFYEQTTHTAAENPLISRSQHIVTTLLSQIDPELAYHLDTIGVAPQIFLIRWIRLLFGREFEFADVLTVWDVVFAEDPTLEIVDHICLTMLLRIRWELLDSSYNEALTVLLHYPSLEHDLSAQSMVVDALALRANMAVSTGNRLVVKYTGRAMRSINRSTTPPAIQRNITSISGMEAIRRLRGPGPQLNFETLQSTAQNLISRGEQLGIGKVMRSAIDDVHRKAQEIRGTQFQSDTWRQRPRSAHSLSSKLKSMDERNTQLAGLLEGAVAQLWEVQKLVADMHDEEKNFDLEKFSLAIGQVQYVQVYLQDSSLPLPEVEAQIEEQTDTSGDLQNEKIISEAHEVVTEDTMPSFSLSPTSSNPPKQMTIQGLSDPADFDDVEVDVQQSIARTGTEDSRSSRLTAPPRPPLSESAYSWMLGQEETTTPRLHTIDKHEGLFENKGSPEDVQVTPKARRGIRPKKKYAPQVVSTDINLNFD